METLTELNQRLAREFQAAYEASPYSLVSRDYFARFVCDPGARQGRNEVALDGRWHIVLPANAPPLAGLMASHLQEFLRARMGIPIQVAEAADAAAARQPHAIALLASGGGDPEVPESYTLSVRADSVVVRAHDPEGLRDGIVRLVDLIGMRQAPILSIGETIYRPRLRVRVGAVPIGSSLRDVVFLGYNATRSAGGLLELSRSDAIPELARFRDPAAAERVRQANAQARLYGLKLFAWFVFPHFPKDDPIFLHHPDMRGALTWLADGEYVLCTEHPVVKRFLQESAEEVFRTDPGMAGAGLIIGGESFYHCFMRPYGVAKGHTTCPRCEALGADRVVANLCNLLGEAARCVNPHADILAWPYSAEHVWSADRAQAGMIHLLGPGTGILTEMEKDEYVTKPEGIRKHLWDYSIDLIGPGERAKQQVAECRAAGIPIFMKHEPGMAFELANASHVPCLDRWWERANAFATCGTSGILVASGVNRLYVNPAMEADRFAWWTPTPTKEEILQGLAARIAGRQAGSHLRRAWSLVSESIEFSPELPPYYTGPRYLGPGHPMSADPEAAVPRIFYGKYLFDAEQNEEQGLKLRPVYFTAPSGDAAAFGRCYRRMEALLQQAVAEVDKADAAVPEAHRTLLAREVSDIRWFYHVARAEANFYESCQLRDRLLALAKQASRTPEETAEAARLYHRWRDVLQDERANAQEGLPIMEADPRLDMYYQAYSHGADIIRAKLQLLEQELGEFLPSLARRLGIPGSAP